MTRFLTSNNILTERQSGLRVGRSCITAIIKIVVDIKEKMDTDNISFLTLLDYCKAIDTVNHEVLCIKLKWQCNFSRASVQLICSYLSNRGQIRPRSITVLSVCK